MANPVPSADYEPLRVFTFVAQTEVWLIWLIYSLLVMLIMTLPYMFVWWMIFGVPFLQFSLNLIESTARGRQLAPRMTWDGFRDGRIFRQLLLTSVVVSAVYAVPENFRVYAIGIVLLICPAMTAFIAMENSLRRAMNPLAIAGFIWHMGLSYILLRLVVTVVLLYLLLLFQYQTALLSDPGGRFVFAVASVYLLLVMSRSVGALIFSRRRELGIRTVASQEQAEEAREEKISSEQHQFLGKLYELSRAGKLTAAWEQLERRLKKDRYETETFYFDELAKWEDTTLKRKLAQGYLKRLVKSAPEQAWPVLEAVIHETSGNFRLDSGEAVLEFARFASTSRQKRFAADLLAWFEDDFPKHPRIREALLTGTDLALDIDDAPLARELFDRVKRMRGLVHKPTYDRCQRLLDST